MSVRKHNGQREHYVSLVAEVVRLQASASKSLNCHESSYDEGSARDRKLADAKLNRFPYENGAVTHTLIL